MDQIIIGRHQTLDYLSSLWQASQIAPCHHCTINWVLVHTISQVYRVIVHYAGAKVLIASLIGFALGPFSVINHFGFLEVIKHVLKFVASQCLRCNVKCFVGDTPDRPYNEESYIVVCSACLPYFDILMTKYWIGGYEGGNVITEECYMLWTRIFWDRNVSFLFRSWRSFMTEVGRMLVSELRRWNSCGARDRPLLPGNLRPYYTCRTHPALYCHTKGGDKRGGSSHS